LVSKVADALLKFFVVPPIAIAEAFSAVIQGAYDAIVKPIWNAVKGFFEFLYSSLGYAVNAVFQTVINVLYTLVINPIKLFAQEALNRLYNKLEGVIFIAIATPLTIHQARKFIEKPSLRGAFMLALKPMIALIASKVVASLVKPMLKPVTIAPSIPPEVQPMPPLKEITISHYDSVYVYDHLTTTAPPPLLLADQVAVDDVISIEAVPPLSFVDYVYVTDELEFHEALLLSTTDSISVEDLLTLE